MHVQFWNVLQSHRWHHTPDFLKQRALLLYQSQQHCRWHLTIGSAQGWSLEELNQDLIFEAREELFNEKREKETLSAIQVCIVLSCSFVITLTSFLFLLTNLDVIRYRKTFCFVKRCLNCQPSRADDEPTHPCCQSLASLNISHVDIASKPSSNITSRKCWDTYPYTTPSG
jgi:hypothetical protein